MGTGATLRRTYPDLEIVTTTGHAGLHGGLYLNLARAFQHALARYEFAALLRLDTDALITGPNPEDDAIACFSADPLIGSAGNYRYEFGGDLRDPTFVADKLRQQTRTLRGLVRHPDRWLALQRVLPRARRNGYFPGEEVFGGACFYSRPGLLALARGGCLPRASLARTTLQEDEIFGLTLRACGYHFCDLWEYNGSFACTWGDLPANPEVLLESTAKVIHSVRDSSALPEADVRAMFRRKRGHVPPEAEVSGRPPGP
jgi:hypothetical protein